MTTSQKQQNLYVPVAADIGHTLRVEVTATNEFGEVTKEPGEGKGLSEPTEVVQPELAQGSDEQLKVEGKREQFITTLKGTTLLEEPYELHLITASKVSREFRGTPLPSGG